jgi:hypothetical protein
MKSFIQVVGVDVVEQVEVIVAVEERRMELHTEVVAEVGVQCHSSLSCSLLINENLVYSL